LKNSLDNVENVHKQEYIFSENSQYDIPHSEFLEGGTWLNIPIFISGE
jgi:hypothetical protein